MRKEIYNNKSKMNTIIQQSLPLPVEMCNIIYEYYKLPFLCDVKRHESWEKQEREFGRELAELVVVYGMSKFQNRFYDSLFGIRERDLNVIVVGQVIWGVGVRELPIKNKIIVAKNVLIYGTDSDIDWSEELDRVVHSNPKHLRYDGCNGDNYMINKIKKRARDNGIRVQHNSKMETLINRLMKL